MCASLFSCPSAWRGLFLKTSLSIASNYIKSRYFTKKRKAAGSMVSAVGPSESGGLPVCLLGVTGAVHQSQLTQRERPGHAFEKYLRTCPAGSKEGLDLVWSCVQVRACQLHAWRGSGCGQRTLGNSVGATFAPWEVKKTSLRLSQDCCCVAEWQREHP